MAHIRIRQNNKMNLNCLLLKKEGILETATEKES